jgi:hypothetical protein
VLERAGDLVEAQRERDLALRLQPDLRMEKVALRL